MSADKHFKGKGSKQRPTDPKNPSAYQDGWDRIFGKDKGLTEREKVLMDPLAASQRSDAKNKDTDADTKTDKQS